ncbi:helicase-like transcription factor isoform X2 [Denticeps clupeoides]|uniref:Helicase-like transcription factor n=1 Tax=Denticeps clupeoides TaxID=299321 RepID=A0AAY4AEJ3_9TELE|nr:helicase-like transcription factor isoform X2 [Denticeps clupeoides]
MRRRFGTAGLDLLDTDPSESVTLSQAVQSSTEEGARPDLDGEAGVLFGAMTGSVVGLRYYTGVVNKREMVSLVREPHNPYDRNAVMVANVYGNQVGHIKKELAAPMAYIMDNNLAKIEGVVPYGKTNKFSMSVTLFFWGEEENRAAVTTKLNHCGFRFDPVKGFKSAKAPGSSLQEMLSKNLVAAVPLTAEQMKNSFDKMFDDLMADKTREMEAADAVFTPLLPHQKQALYWMAARENNDHLPPFWEQKGDLYVNVLTNFGVKQRPERVLGGILADDMGLGKTLTTIALIMSNFHDGRPLLLDKADQKASSSLLKRRRKDPIKTEKAASPKKARTAEKASSSAGGAVLLEDAGFAAALAGGSAKSKKTKSGADSRISTARATLIICPLSVLSNWLDQFEQHVRFGENLSVYLYYGTERCRDHNFLSRQDVVLTTYNVLSADYGNKESSPLHKVSWLRVVLDEGHVVRNPNAQQTKAVLDLSSERRWILSGTPIQNSLKDLWVLMAFLKLKPFDVKEWWNRVIQRPVTQGDRESLKNLQALIKGITLRRTKTSKVAGKSVVELPQKKMFVQRVTLSEEERQEYDLAKTEGQKVIGRYVTEGTVLTNYADVLAILVRLRQICCHPGLLGSYARVSSGDTSAPSDLQERLISKIRLVLSCGSDEECAICLDSLRQPVITYCAHVFCRPCICEVIRSEQERAKCPLCRAHINTKELVEYPGDKETGTSTSGKEKWRSSSKVDALMGRLLQVHGEDPAVKSLVVSQFTRFLTLLETPLRQHGFTFTRLDGSMNQRSRVKAIAEFQDSSPSSPSIMLLSLTAGGVGLNLTAASRVFMMDPSWNPAAEDQCVDRCHRLGQTRDVIITKFIVKNSVEEDMMRIQLNKKELMEKTFGSKSVQDQRQSRIEEIKTMMAL